MYSLPQHLWLLQCASLGLPVGVAGDALHHDQQCFFHGSSVRFARWYAVRLCIVASIALCIVTPNRLLLPHRFRLLERTVELAHVSKEVDRCHREQRLVLMYCGLVHLPQVPC